MSRFGGWFGTAKKADSPALSPSAGIAREKENLVNAMKWVELIMNDDIDGAWEKLQQGDSSFHELGSAVAFFMRSVLGFEKSVMTEATARLADCETRAWSDLRRAQKSGVKGSPSRIYPPGTEYELVIAEAQLMGAIVGVLHESLVEGMRSFYRLRKAFLTLDAIIAREAKLGARLGSRGGDNDDDDRPQRTPNGNNSGSNSGSEGKMGEEEQEEKEDGKDDDNDDAVLAELRLDDSNGPSKDPPPLHIKSTFAESEPANVGDLEENPVDGFIHSGANMCFGILLLILSLVPPSFSRILSIVGFRGDRPRAVKMLWRSASHPNVNGAVSGMMLLAYYNGLLGAADILPHTEDYDDDAEAVGPPRDKCVRLLAEMRARYPDSRLWRVEESRMHANDGDVTRAIQLLRTGKESRMKQVAALNNFELSINAMVIQDWPLMRDQFLSCLDVNDWSPSMYYYMAACATLELYRDAHHSASASDEDGRAEEARRQKAKTEEYLRKAPSFAGKKRLMARQMPLETFLQRKIEKWEARAKLLGVDLADAIGPSPALEMCYVWNGQKRMSADHLRHGLGVLDWGRCTAPAHVVDAIRAERDETAVWALTSASLLRGLGRWEEARTMLKDHILSHDRSVFRGPTKDDYVLPSAHYEMGAIAWAECCRPPADQKGDEALEYRRSKMVECRDRLNVVKTWEAFILDGRIGMRATSGLETLTWFKRKMGWA